MPRFTPFAVLSIALGVCVIAPAQQDVPPGHWAYEAVQTLVQQGVLKGYPDGSFGGAKPLTRSEFAVALRNALQEVRSRVNDLRDELRERILLPPPPTITPPPVIDHDTFDYEREKLRALPDNAGEQLQRLEEQMRVLNRLFEEFVRDLQTLGEDVRRLRSEISGMESQVRSLEQRLRQRTLFSGTVDLIGRGAHGMDNKGAVDQNGYAFNGGLLNNVRVIHELNLRLRADISPTLHSEAALVVGNLLTYLGSASQFAPGVSRTPGATDFLLWKANLRLPVHLFGRQGSLSVGRIENRVTPLTLWRPDVDVYTLLPRYDSGYYSMDGLKFQIDTDLVSLMLYAARHNAVNTNTLADFMRVSAGNDAVNLFQPGNPLRQRPNRIPYGIVHARHSAGASATLRLGRAFNVGAQFLVLDAWRDVPTVFGTVNQVNVWGWQVEMSPSDRWDIATVYAQSDLLHHGDNRLNKDNWAFLAKVQYNAGKEALVWLGYRDFRPYFAPPGYWGRIGYWHNPTDLRGMDVGLRTRIGSVALDARGGFYTGTGKAAPPAGFGTDDEVVHLVVNTHWQAFARWEFGLTYEGAFWNLKDPQRFNPGAGLSAPGKPQEHYVTFGMRYGLSKDTVLRALYQAIFTNARGVASYSLLGSDKERGGVAVVQLNTAF
ncbi:MAG: S-layer homology domain-containing protein [Armatimonadota bacterium]|nr:S-layer homology domain-containing protein [bacterium]MDW8320246.1 S-layer homology domain-containing protein [Armatimonadota bacterium]